MKRTENTATSGGAEKALLVELLLKNDAGAYRRPLEEMTALAQTAGLEVVDTVVQRRVRPDPAYCIGRGKAEELAGLVDERDADVVAFDNDLTPAQVRNLEKTLGTKVIDRSELILDIFAAHARTEQARVQVELAQLEYSLPRLRRMWTHLSRIEGGIGLRGPGEKQLEVDRRLARKRIGDLKRTLKKNEARRKRIVASRKNAFNVSLVGYTNAGKSTLMNRMTSAGVKVEDKLFATLDTKTSSFKLPGGRKVLLSDTVGFIRNLPHHLVASFHATLQEALGADLLLHVVDASHEDARLQIDVVQEVLEEIGCGDRPRLLVLNKMDRVREQIELQALLHEFSDVVAISARTGEGVEEMKAVVEQILGRDLVTAEIRLPQSAAATGGIRAAIKRGAGVLEESVADGVILMRVRIRKRDFGRLAKMATVDVRRL
ncbi:MAG: GTPase HflX [Planctomycetota bacterium]|nr:MAG: GTPase HflX [Planctomycetota bacterium]